MATNKELALKILIGHLRAINTTDQNLVGIREDINNIADQMEHLLPNEKFIMVCNTFGPKFLFHAKDQYEAEKGARKYCAYHSQPDQFKAVKFDDDNDYGLNLKFHNEWVG